MESNKDNKKWGDDEDLLDDDEKMWDNKKH